MSQFHGSTIRLMINLFDANKDGSIDYQEFTSLIDFLGQWRRIFDEVDTDGSQNIQFLEFEESLKKFGFRLSPLVSSQIFQKFAYTNRQTGDIAIEFDRFVYAFIRVLEITKTFSNYDVYSTGRISLSYDEFLLMIMRLRSDE